ncbi:Zinc finger SWIM domain-containing protein 7 [Tetrabaena socialis]|uniref:Zinc finger SWIM domain-containing protein 7 n=1 Tax=Tetrabaena socialis TaxID=47790 RepID=A0A2J8A7Q7_9CHLO|nr:Zinc finger SWIM domain-containing protein 7 [Tetrabaena socialis]|eukprot:PNH08548.1 Zinc finger SWIM domain-containing protein 7 [Tetrabaena socialis]
MNSSPGGCVVRAGDACFAELQELVALNPNNANIEIPDETLAGLYLIFGKNFAKAVEVVDGGGIVCYIGEQTGRRLFKVPGSHAPDFYIVFPAHYCSCQSFTFDVVSRSDAAFCKHQLAARLATVMKRSTEVTIPDITIALMLLEQCA